MRDLIGFAMMAVVVTPFAFLVFGLPLYGLRRRLDPFLDLMALVALVLIVSVAPAMAQAVASVPVANADTLFHIPPLVWTEINELLVGLFLAIGAGVWKWIDAHSPLKKTQAEEISRNAFQALLLTGAKFGLSQLKGQEEKVGDINVGNPAVAAAANFVIAHGPALAAKIGVDVSTADGQAAIIRSVTARLSMLLPGNVVVQPGGAVEDVGAVMPVESPTSIPLPAEVQPVSAPAGQPTQPPAPTPAPAPADPSAEAPASLRQ
jgi:hypothetical protein